MPLTPVPDAAAPVRPVEVELVLVVVPRPAVASAVLMSSGYVGLVVPMPKRPSRVSRIRSVTGVFVDVLVLKMIGAGLVVPRKLVPSVLMVLLPVMFHGVVAADAGDRSPLPPHRPRRPRRRR